MPRLLSPFLIGAVVLFASALVFGQYGFEGAITRDIANALYSGQQMARGVPHYVSIFNHSGTLGPLISGAGVWLATLFNSDDILTVRILFFIIGSLAAVSIYFLGSTLFESRKIGLLAAFTFTGFYCFGKHTIAGPSGKVLMVLLVTLALLLTVRKKWFWAAVFGSLAFLAWQPAAIYPLLTFLLAVAQSERGRERARNLIGVVSGALIPVILVSIYFLYKGAFYEFIDGTILFNLFYLEREPSSLLIHLGEPVMAIYRSYTLMVIPIFLGFMVVCMIYIWRLKLHGGSILRFASNDHFAAILLSLPAPVIWSVLDFQGCLDLFVFLPYVAIGFAWLLYLAFQRLMEIGEIKPAAQELSFLILCGALIAGAAGQYRRAAESGLREQRQWAREVETQFGRDCKLVSIGAPDILVLLHRTNPNPYVFIISGIDNRINADTPGGFDGWLNELERYDPDVIALGITSGRFKSKLIDWLHIHYQETTIGTWTLLVKENVSGDTRIK